MKREERIKDLARRIAATQALQSKLVAALERELGENADELAPRPQRHVTEVDRARAARALAKRGIHV